jgi:hypothetical protein
MKTAPKIYLLFFIVCTSKMRIYNNDNLYKRLPAYTVYQLFSLLTSIPHLFNANMGPYRNLYPVTCSMNPLTLHCGPKRILKGLSREIFLYLPPHHTYVGLRQTGLGEDGAEERVLVALTVAGLQDRFRSYLCRTEAGRTWRGWSRGGCPRSSCRCWTKDRFGSM